MSENIVKEILLQDKGILPTTNTTCTTFTTLKNWGLIDLDNKILIEQLSKKEYAYNINGKIGVAQLKFKCKTCGSLFYFEKDVNKAFCSCNEKLTYQDQGLFINDLEFPLKQKPKDPLYLTPDMKDLEEYFAYVNRIPSTREIFDEIKSILLALFDFKQESDAKILALAIMFTYLLKFFNSSFYVGIDATKGSGKTTLLEIISILSRHGFLADVSPASIPRLKEKYDLNIFIDEIDQLRNGEDIEGLLRKGQRRGNKYVRLNKNTLEEEIYEAFGFYAYSFRSSVEDAFKQRSVLLRTARAKDSRLSIINLDKVALLKPLFTRIFMWYLSNIFVFGSKSSTKYEVVRGFTHANYQKLRDDIYSEIVKEFSKEEKCLINKLFGRNSEIGYLFLQTSKFIGIDLLEEISQTMSEKQTEEETPDDYYFELIKDIFVQDIRNNTDYLLQKGEFVGYRYFPKTPFYMKLVGKLKERNLMGIGTPKYNQLLKDIGFIQNYNIKNQKVKGDPNPKPCLIFSQDVINKLNIDYEVPIKPEVQKIQ